MSPISNQQLLEILTSNDDPTTTKPVQKNKDANQIVCTDSQPGATSKPSSTQIAKEIEGGPQLRVVLERIPPKRLAELMSGEPKTKRLKLTTTTAKRVDLTADSPDADFSIVDIIDCSGDVVGIILDDRGSTSAGPEPQQNGPVRQNISRAAVSADLFHVTRSSTSGHSLANTANRCDSSSEVNQANRHQRLLDPRLASRRMPGPSYNQSVYFMKAQSPERNDLDHDQRQSAPHVTPPFPPVGCPRPLLTVHHQPCNPISIPSHQIDGLGPIYSSHRSVDQMATSSFQIPHLRPINPVNPYPSHPMSIPSHPMNIPSHPMNIPSHPMSIPSHPMSIPSHPMNIPSHPMNIPSHQTEGLGPMRSSHPSVNQMAPTSHQIHHPTPINPSHQMAGPFHEVSCPMHKSPINHQPSHQMNIPWAPYSPPSTAEHDQRPSASHMAETAHFNSYRELLNQDTPDFLQLDPEQRRFTSYSPPSQQNINHQVQSPTSEADNESVYPTSPQTINDTDVSNNERHSVPDSNLQDMKLKFLSVVSEFVNSHSAVNESIDEVQNTISALKSRHNQIRRSFLGLLELITRL